jgi:cytidylate kinase
MACRVICFSRSLGAGGEEVGRLVAAKTGFRYVDEEIIVRAANEAGVSPEEIGEVERSRPLLLRILESMAAASPDPAVVPADQYVQTYQSKNYERLIQHVIRETAAEGDVVLVAHGASIPLAGIEGCLRVFITASPETRVQRLAAQEATSPKDAEKTIQKSDKERHDFLQRFYDVKQELPTHYDLVINTDSVAFERAADLVLAAARP